VKAAFLVSCGDIKAPGSARLRIEKVKQAIYSFKSARWMDAISISIVAFYKYVTIKSDRIYSIYI
jgi:hypothetical protein